MNDTELLSAFETGTLESFPHESHLRVVYLLIRRDGVDDALTNMSARIKAWARASGRPEAFHVTRTTAWTLLVAELGDAGGSLDLLAGHPELTRRDLLNDYYSPGRLATDEARTTYLPPDLKPFTR
ncbi:MAG: hypothetical protein ABI632_04960 [Pseudolysinimonas sp.]